MSPGATTPGVTTPDSGWLRDRRVWVIGSGHDILTPLAAGLTDHGAHVIVASNDATTARDVAGAFETLASTEATLQRLADKAGDPDLVVISILPPQAMRLAPLVDLSEAEWRAGACDGLHGAVFMLQVLGARIKGRGVAVVLVGPSLSLVGCPDLVALTTLQEGLRGLVKSVARQWGGSGVTLNWIAAAPRALSAAFDAAPLAAKPDAVSVALGRPLDPRADIAPIVGFLASPAGRAITGASLTLDGGEWMVP